MAHFDRAVSPGGEGWITLTVKTKGYQGQVSKNARVYTNDPHNTVLRINLKGFVKVPIFIFPRYVHFVGKPDQVIAKKVEVRSELDKPLELKPFFFNLVGKVSYKIQEIEPGRKFHILLETIPGNHTSYRGFLRLKTNYPEKPEIFVQLRGRFK